MTGIDGNRCEAQQPVRDLKEVRIEVPVDIIAGTPFAGRIVVLTRSRDLPWRWVEKRDAHFANQAFAESESKLLPNKPLEKQARGSSDERMSSGRLSVFLSQADGRPVRHPVAASDSVPTSAEIHSII